MGSVLSIKDNVHYGSRSIAQEDRTRTRLSEAILVGSPVGTFVAIATGGQSRRKRQHCLDRILSYQSQTHPRDFRECFLREVQFPGPPRGGFSREKLITSSTVWRLQTLRQEMVSLPTFTIILPSSTDFERVSRLSQSNVNRSFCN